MPMYQPFGMRRFLLPLAHQSSVENRLLFAGILYILTLLTFIPVPLLLIYLNNFRGHRLNKNYIFSSLTYIAYLVLMCIRIVVRFLPTELTVLNNGLIYGMMVLLPVTVASLWKAQNMTYQARIPLYYRIAGDVGVYFAFVSSAGFILTTNTLFLRMLEFSFSSILIIGYFSSSKGGHFPLFAKAGKWALITTSGVSVIILLRSQSGYSLALIPEIALGIGSLSIGFGATLSLVHEISQPLSHTTRSKSDEEFFNQQTKLFHLSTRETEILRMLLEGKSTKLIAQAFACSEKTIRNHISHIYEKTEVHSRVDLVLVFTPA